MVFDLYALAIEPASKYLLAFRVSCRINRLVFRVDKTGVLRLSQWRFNAWDSLLRVSALYVVKLPRSQACM
jgi:hypothetical protein